MTPEKPQRQASSKRDDGDIDVALLEDAVADDELVEIVAHLEKGVAERLDVVDQIGRQILMHPAGPHVIGVHARAGGALVEHHQLLALLEAPERRRQGADVHRLRGDVEEVRKQAPDLGIEHADELTALRHLEPEQLLDGEAEGMLLVHRRDVIEPVEIRDRLQVGLGLDQLLGAAVEKADMRVDALDDLAVELEHEAQDAVRGRVLRPEIDREIAELVLGHRLKFVILGRRKATRGPHLEESALIVPRSSALRCAPAEDDARVSRSPRLPTADCPLPNPRFFIPGQHVVRAFPGRQKIEVAEFLLQSYGLIDDALLLLVVADLDEARQGEVLAQGVTLEAVIGEDAAQVRVAGEQDPVEVVGLALEPVGGREHVDHGGHRRHLVGLDLDADARVPARRQEVVDDVEPLLAAGIVDPAEIDEADELAAAVVAQKRQHARDRLGRHHDRQLAIGDLPGRDRRSERGGDVIAESGELIRHAGPRLPSS